MNGYAGNVVEPGVLYVRALYDYDADDRTSLSFRQGDVIQVITQLESGWWDGVINGVRGWFPSNYCAVVPRTSEDGTATSGSGSSGDAAALRRIVEDTDDDDDDAEIKEEYDRAQYRSGVPSTNESISSDLSGLTLSPSVNGGDTNHDREPDEAAFWIPQAMPDGRLYYFNTLTWRSRMELPLETLTSGNENGPRDRTRVNIPSSTAPPPELNEDDTDYDTAPSDVEGKPSNRPRNNVRANASAPITPSTSTDSLADPGAGQSGRDGPTFLKVKGRQDTSMTSFTSGALGVHHPQRTRKYFDDLTPVTLTWNRLVDDMRRSIERYRQTINADDKSDFVRRVDDISDHLRLVFAAGSGTTDNHSGNPSIINSNRSLYPHFRETMSRFSKLVLSSHIAGGDEPAPDSFTKCLREAEGVLNGVYGFVEVARRQRGEEIPRLIPGFLANAFTGGSWQNNGVPLQDGMPQLSFADEENYEPLLDPVKRLDSAAVQKLEDFRRAIIDALRVLETQLVVRDKLITPQKHQDISDAVCKACKSVLDFYAPWIQLVESFNLATIGSGFSSTSFTDYSVQKQQVYDNISELVLACQAVAAPLGDEWSESWMDSLEDRLVHVRNMGKGLEQTTLKVVCSLQIFSDMAPAAEPSIVKETSPVMATSIGHARAKSISSDSKSPLPHRPSMSSSIASTVDPSSSAPTNGAAEKAPKYFGGVPPPPALSTASGDEIPDYLRLEYEGELAYDMKNDPPTLRGGTLMALVEQVTRHDRLDAVFNNTFLLSYRSFTTGAELFELLVGRWKIQPPYSLSQADFQEWAEKKQKPIRFRVVNILKSWMENYWMEPDNEDSQRLISRIEQFAQETVLPSNIASGPALEAAVQQRKRGQDAPSKRLVMTLNTQTPQPILPKNMKKLQFLDIDETEFARQLTIIESRLYGKIKAQECLNKTWQKKIDPTDPDPAKNVKELILHSNQLTNWVAQMILAQPAVKNRVVVIKRFVNVAEKCRQLNNFSTLTSIMSALGTAPIHRLSRTWNGVNARTMATLDTMRKLMGSTKNFNEYRETLSKAQPPCIPFFGVFLTDLTFIEDGIPSLIKKTNLINFAKRAKSTEVISAIQQYQTVPYPLQPVPELQDYILKNMTSAGDVHEMYEMSLEVEPREREDEKIARLVDLGLL